MKFSSVRLFMSFACGVLLSLLVSCQPDPKPPYPDLPTPGKTCKSCNGEFEIICPECNGMKEVTCERCKGLRGKRINCSNCDHGKVKSFLGGEKDCDKCNGKGIITEYCSKCSGKGRVNCEQCRGTGKIDCPECSPKAPK